jgi:RHS repeat protein
MTNRTARAAARLALILCCLTLPLRSLWAQNENETVGFQSNHMFESGHFGEDIDVLNGGLNLTVPIGPKYQVNDRLSYQLVLHYSSKVWETSDYSGSYGDSIKLIHEGPMGLGFTLSFGRLLQDVHSTPTGYERIWKWVTADGNQHDVWYSKLPANAPAEYPLKTGDTSYIEVNNPGCNPTETGPCTVSTPDGLTYTLARHVSYPDPTGSSGPDVRADNLSFGGWYVTRIEDRSIGSPDVTNSYGTTGSVTGLYPNHVVISYDTRSNFEHAIKEIRDSRGRVITFHNCRYATSTTCVDDGSGASDRSQVATQEIDLPAFSAANASADSEAIDSSSAAMAVYKFAYTYATVNRFHPEPGGMTVDPAGPTLELKRVDYPEYVHRNGTHETYSLYFGYGFYAELDCRTLPLPKDESKVCSDWQGHPPSFSDGKAIFEYAYDYYTYLPVYLSPGSAGIGQVFDGTPARGVVAKTILEPLPSGQATRSWTYVRYMSQGTTNPNQVTVTDAVGNDTVYYYHASYFPADQNPLDQLGILPDDGLAPEWNDGLNYKIEYYRGHQAGGVLIRTENREYETDTRYYETQLHMSKDNSRVQRTATVFNDDGAIEAVVSNSGWDNRGNWRTVSETGFGVPGVRNSHTDYSTIDYLNAYNHRIYLTGVSNYREVHDGFRVLERTDTFYNSGDGRLATTIARKTLPATLGSPRQTSSQKGDVKTTYNYDPATRRLDSKYIASSGDGAAADYCIYYTWTPDMYLKSKTFGNVGANGLCDPGSLLSWKAIDRLRDGNTGLIYEVHDPSYVAGSNELKTKYLYDALGRVTDIVPTAPEFPTVVDYASLKETTVTRNPASTTDFEFSRYRYDDLGRLVCEERRPADPSSGYPYQTKRYDIFNRVVFSSEWLSGGTSCDPNTSAGTASDYGTPPDPFGRIQRATTVDGKVATTTYQGQDSTVTVEGIVGPGGAAVPVTTRFYRDAWGRLIKVDPPNNGGAKADYAYDLRGNVVKVDLYDQTNPLIKQTRLFEYDGLNKLFQAINPESNSILYSEYDGLGNARSITGADGVTLQYTYDVGGRLRAVQRSGSTILLVENSYDAGANASSKISSSISREEGGPSVVTKTLTYGGLNGRVSVLNQTIGGVSSAFPTTYTYDNYGNVATLSYPEGPAGQGGSLNVGYTYSNGVPVAVRDLATSLTLASVTYNPAGGIQNLTTPQSMTTTITPDDRNRPRKITIGRGTYNVNTDVYSERTDYQSGSFNYDGAGNIYEMDRANGLKNLYRYDAANRLVEAYDQIGDGLSNYTQYTQCFRYDDFGNILGKKDQTTTNSCSQISGEDVVLLLTPPSGVNTNRILNEQRTGVTPIVNFIYDAKGNVIKDWERRYRYDSRNRMLSLSRVSDISDMSSPSTELALYGYDGDGNRVKKHDRLRELKTFYIRGPDGQVLSEFRRTELGTYQPEWFQHHVYLAGREVALRENRIPTPPGGLAKNTGPQQTGTVKLKFRKNPTEDNVSGYRLYRDSGYGMSLVGNPSTACPDPNFICYTDTGLSPGASVQYQVTAVSSIGESFGSDVLGLVVGDSTKPFPPTCVTGIAGDGQVTLSWGASVSDDVLGYNVYRRTGTTGSIIKVTQLLVADLTYVDFGLTNGQIYNYWIRAVDNSANESLDVVNGGKTCGPTGVSCSTTADCTCIGCDYLCGNICGSSTNTTFSAMPKDYIPPGPPREVTAVGDCGGQGTAHVTWDANAETDGVQTYWMYRTPDFSPPGPRSSGNDGQGKANLFFDDTGLSSSNTYFYYVKAEDNKFNRSLASLQVGVKPRAPLGLLQPPPNQLNIQAGDGQVRVRFEKPQDTSSISSFVIYRRPNSEPSCTAFQELHEMIREEWPQNATYLDYHDGTVANAVAWDYAVASRDAGGNESALSKLGLAIPVAPPKNYKECVEENGEGAVFCGAGPFRRTVMRWGPAPGKPYHPIGASNADGTLGYLLGYHVQRYSQRVNWNTDSSVFLESPFYDYGPISTDIQVKNLHCSTTIGSDWCEGDRDTRCENWETCVSMGRCVMDSSPTCDRSHGDADCAAGTYCFGTCSLNASYICRMDSTCSNLSAGTCGTVGVCHMLPGYPNFAPPCVQKADCPATASCRRYDPNVPFQNEARGPLPTDPYLHEGADLEEYYPFSVFETHDCGGVAAVYKVYANGSWQTVVSHSTNFDPTMTGADTNETAQRCSSLLNQCNFDAPLCSAAVEAPTVVQAPTVISPAPGQIKVIWDDLSGSANAAGYYLYVKENDNVNSNVQKPPHPFGFVSPLPYVTLNLSPQCLDNGKPCYLLTGLPDKGRIGTSVTYQFQVAVFDPAGNPGRASPLSTEITPQVSPDPVGLKTVIWTQNDASKDGPAPYGIANPRGFDGIKLQWTGTANRVYRSESQEGPFCVILQVGQGTPTDRAVCPDTTAFSTTQTTGQSGSNTRFFLDKNVIAGNVYYYKVTVFNGSSETGFSNVVQGMALRRAAQPLSPPRHRKRSQIGVLPLRARLGYE